MARKPSRDLTGVERVERMLDPVRQAKIYSKGYFSAIPNSQRTKATYREVFMGQLFKNRRSR